MRPPIFLLAAIAVSSTGVPAFAGRAVDLAVDVEVQRPASALTEPTRVLYLNGCFGGSCSVGPGYDDARENRSSVLNQNSSIPSFAGTASDWNQITSCVRNMFAPFGVTVTDANPGTQPHFEVVVGGTPSDIGYPDTIGGVAPFNCDVIDNAMAFVFPSVLDNDPQSICETVAHEIAHTWGLEHAYLCPDPMSYLDGCGKKSFQDQAAECGDDSPRPCRCGRDKQNSYQILLQTFGPKNPTPPSVTIMRPSDGTQVQPGFEVEVEAFDADSIAKVDLFINGQLVASATDRPYLFTAPKTLGNGAYDVEVRAYDSLYASAAQSIRVRQGQTCTSDRECTSGELCFEGRCAPGPGVAGGLGEICTTGDQCASGLCVTGDDGKTCAEPCSQQCPDSFECRAASYGSPVCLPSATAGCHAADHGPPWILLLFGAAMMCLSRRRKPC